MSNTCVSCYKIAFGGKKEITILYVLALTKQVNNELVTKRPLSDSVENIVKRVENHTDFTRKFTTIKEYNFNSKADNSFYITHYA